MDSESTSNEDVVYKVKEVSRKLGFSRKTVTQMFENEPGVIVVERPEEMHKRGYRSIRIPRAVYLRVRKKFTM